MFYAMNRFDIPLEHCEAFEARWLNRDSKLHEFEGFVEFNLLKGPVTEDERLYISHTVWQDEANFQTWLKSISFKEAHARPKPAEGAAAAEQSGAEQSGAGQPAAQPERKMISRNKFEALSSVQRIVGKVSA